ncbi:MAG: glycosyltransferase [Bacteroidia bacterium]
MKILYLSYDGITDQLGQSQVLPYLTGLSDRGHHIHLISCEKPGRFEKFRNTIESLIKKTKITWHPLTYHKSPPVLSTIIDINQIHKKAFALQKQFQFDIVHCRSYITPFIGLAMKKKFGVKFIFDMRGFYADERVDGKIWNLKNPLFANIYRYFKKKEKEFLINADHIVSLTYTAEKILQNFKLNGENKLPITVIPCCADLNLFNFNNYNDETKSVVRKNLNINSDAFVLTYLGAIGTWYMLDEMIDFFANLISEKKDAVFLFITNESPELINQHASQKNISLSQLRIVSAQRNEVPQYLSVTDVSVFFIVPTFSKKASSPTKQGELMGMGIPIICNAGVGDTDYIVNQTNCGFVLNNFEKSDFEKAAKQIDAIKNLDKEKIREGAQQFYSLEKGVEKYDEIYKAIGKN